MANSINAEASSWGDVHFREFGTLDFERYSLLLNRASAKRTWFQRIDFVRGTKTARYLYFFGYASTFMRARCNVVLHIAREEPPNSFHYERLDNLHSPNIPSLREIGYEVHKGRFVARMCNARPRKCEAGKLVQGFLEDIVTKHFSN